MFWVFFIVCLLCFGVRTAYNCLKCRQQESSAIRWVNTAVYLNMAILWGAWFSMNFWDPVRNTLPTWLRILGLLFFIAGILLFVLGDTAMRGLAQSGKLVTKGVFSKIRHPVYLGFILWVIGFPVFMQSMLTLASSVIWIIFFLYWKHQEELELERKYPEYRDYKRSTWF
jgi:protein-S-isoprenylcysteine O-methyltransferase Ste14